MGNTYSLVGDTNAASPSHRAAVVTAGLARKPVGTVGLVMLARPQWLRASGSRGVASTEFPVVLTCLGVPLFPPGHRLTS